MTRSCFNPFESNSAKGRVALSPTEKKNPSDETACVQRPALTHLCGLPAPLGVKRLQLWRGGSGHLQSILHPKASAHGWSKKPVGQREQKAAQTDEERYSRQRWACECICALCGCIVLPLTVTNLQARLLLLVHFIMRQLDNHDTFSMINNELESPDVCCACLFDYLHYHL